MPEGQWDVWDTPAGIQTVPHNDIIDHVMGGQLCICGPTIEEVGRKHVDNMQINRKHIIHNVFDGTELL